jgi:3-deoxy-D-manno-octulosonic-acid transferase
VIPVFDRVYENASNPKEIPLIKAFTNNSPVLICGSTWPADENILAELVVKYPDWKFILAPHEIEEHHIESIQKLFPKAVRFTKLNEETNPGQQTVLIIDNIGMLSSLYQYGSIAYIGGGFGAGIHNTLEAAAFGLPVIFGPKYHKFQEAKDLLKIDAAKTVSTAEELSTAFDHFIDNKQASIAARNYVDQKKGASEIIIKEINL